MFSLDDAPSTLDPPGERRLTWLEFGDPAGPPVILLHGTPGSRHQLAYLDAPDLPAGRYIAIDRPGYGGSSIDLAAMLDDTPADLVRLADHLGLDTFFVMGVSGGAPAAIAAAALIPTRVRGVAAVSTAVPPHPDTLARERAEKDAATSDSATAESPSDRDAGHESSATGETSPGAPGLDDGAATIATIETSPTLDEDDVPDEVDDNDDAPPPRRYSGRVLLACKIQVQVSKWWPALARRTLKRHVSSSDVALLETPAIREILRADSRHPSSTTAEAILLDVDQCAEVWLLPVEEITAPVAIWHGTDDRTVPIDRARELHTSLPTSTLHEIDGEGHFIFFSHFGEILSDLVG